MSWQRHTLGKSQRTKGASYEREICAELSAALGVKIERNIGQARDGGNDIDAGILVVECKRRKTLGTVYSWLNQARAAATLNTGDRRGIPIVVARQDGDMSSLVILDLNDFVHLAGDKIRASL